MSKRVLILLLASFVVVIAIVVGFGQSFNEQQQEKKALDQTQQQTNDYLTENGLKGYEYHHEDTSMLALFTNEDETVLGLVETLSTGDYASATREITPNQAMDLVHLGSATVDYIGVRLNDHPKQVAYLRLNGSDQSEEFVVHRPSDEGYMMTYVIKMNKLPDGDVTIESLDYERNVLHSISL